MTAAACFLSSALQQSFTAECYLAKYMLSLQSACSNSETPISYLQMPSKTILDARSIYAKPYSACRPIGVAPLKVAPKSARYVSNTGLVGLVEVVGL